MTELSRQPTTPNPGVAEKQPKRKLPAHLKTLERWANAVWAIGVLSILGGLFAGVVIGGQTDRTSRYGDEELTHLAEGIGVAVSGVVVGLLLGLVGNFALAWVVEHDRRDGR